MRGTVTPAGQAAGTVPILLLLTMVVPVLTASLIGTVHASPVQAEDAAPLTSDQVLRRVVAWLESEEAQQRQQQQQRSLDNIQEQMEHMALELERLETKMDIKIDTLQEVLIGRDIKEDETSRRQGAQLDRTALLLTEVSGQLQIMDSHIKGSLDQMSQKITTIRGQVQVFQANDTSDMKQQQPTASDVTAEGSSDVTPELRRLADGVERLQQRADLCRSDTNRTASGGETQRNTDDGTEQHGNGASETQGDGGSNGQRPSETEDRGLYRQVESSRPALKLLKDIAQLELQVISVSDQLNDGLEWLDEQVGIKFSHGLNRLNKQVRRKFNDRLEWLDEQVGRKFGDLKDELAGMASSLRNRFFERRDHLEEVAAKILAAAVDGQRGGREGMAAPTDSGIAALEAAIYDFIDMDLWYMLSTKLEEAVSGQGNMTVRIGQMESDMHQGFDKLYAVLTKLSQDLVKSAQDQTTQDLGASSRVQNDTELTTQLGYMLRNISQHLHGIQLKLAGQQTT